MSRLITLAPLQLQLDPNYRCQNLHIIEARGKFQVYFAREHRFLANNWQYNFVQVLKVLTSKLDFYIEFQQKYQN